MRGTPRSAEVNFFLENNLTLILFPQNNKCNLVKTECAQWPGMLIDCWGGKREMGGSKYGMVNYQIITN